MGVTYNYGAGPTYTKIASQTLGSAAASVTLSNLPQNYTDLVLVVYWSHVCSRLCDVTCRKWIYRYW
jgi:hypothetical protein